jgi:ribosome biogenesis GTPase / thiamine phosphate phosphatase
MSEFLDGTVERIDANLSRVRCGNRIYDCEIRKKLFRYDPLKTDIAVGDVVSFDVIEEGRGVIEKVLPRKSKLSRCAVIKDAEEQIIAANIDQLVSVSSAKEPKLNLHLIDRYLVAAEKHGFSPVICINKIELVESDELKKKISVYDKTPYPVILVSARLGTHINELMKLLAGKNSILSGYSGVGKSSIINAIVPEAEIETKEISQKWKKGKHATTAVTMIHLPFGGYVIDTPGIREFGLWDIKRRELSSLFPDFAPFIEKCRFRNCAHLTDPDCAVREASEKGDIHPSRYDSYAAIYKSLPEERNW